MAKLSLEELRNLREGTRNEMSRREAEGKEIRIVIGMGTCGIAAGAKEAFDAFVDELGKKNITTALVRQTGCMGFCYAEPTVEIHMPGMPDTIYGKVNGDVARAIVNQHIIAKAMVSDHIFDKPSTDILAKK